MNYYQARQRESDKRFDFTCKNDDRIWPVGYCAGFKEYTVDQFAGWYPDPERAVADAMAEQAPFQDKYHTDGHATAEEAERCYYEWELDHSREGAVSGAQYPCAICGAWTQKTMEMGESYMTSATLCEPHCNRAGLELAKPFQPGMTIMSS